MPRRQGSVHRHPAKKKASVPAGASARMQPAWAAPVHQQRPLATELIVHAQADEVVDQLDVGVDAGA